MKAVIESMGDLYCIDVEFEKGGIRIDYNQADLL